MKKESSDSIDQTAKQTKQTFSYGLRAVGGFMLEVSSETFAREVLQSEKPVLVDFWGPRCAPCLALMPQVEKLEATYGSKVKIVKVDASKNQRLCLELKVLGLPTYLFYKNGQVVGRLTGGDLKIKDIEDQTEKIA